MTPQTTLEQDARRAYRAMQDESAIQGNSRFVGFLFGCLTAWLAWQATRMPLVALIAFVLGAPFGYWIGYKCAGFFKLLFGLITLIMLFGLAAYIALIFSEMRAPSGPASHTTVPAAQAASGAPLH